MLLEVIFIDEFLLSLTFPEHYKRRMPGLHELPRDQIVKVQVFRYISTHCYGVLCYEFLDILYTGLLVYLVILEIFQVSSSEHSQSECVWLFIN